MKWIKIILTLTVIVCLLLILVNAGHWLVVDQPPRKADVIIVLSGEWARTQRGIDLYHMGYAPYLLLTGSDSSIEAIAVDRGVPARAIILEGRADSTYENALYSRALMEQHGLRSALVVSSDYHMLRARLTFLYIFKKTGISLTFSSIRNPRFNNGNRWWTSSRNIRLVLREYGGIAALYLGMGPYATDTLINRSPLLSFIFNS